MAKDNKNNDDENAGDAVEADLVKKAKRKKLLLIVGLILLLVAISVGSTLALVKLFADPAPEVAAEDAEQAPEEEQVEAKKPAIYYPMQPVFVVNFLSEGRQRFLQAELNLLLREQDVIPALELHMPAIRNSLVMLFSDQLYEDLQTAEGKELLRQQALLSVQEVLQKEIGKPGVEQVLFTNFVMQ
jgi:flagellar FliL protein